MIKCDCGRRYNVLNPLLTEISKSHAHCRECGLEWHLTWDGRRYAHKWKPKK